jgi:hypothetical protein
MNTQLESPTIFDRLFGPIVYTPGLPPPAPREPKQEFRYYKCVVKEGKGRAGGWDCHRVKESEIRDHPPEMPVAKGARVCTWVPACLDDIVLGRKLRIPVEISKD